MKLKNKKQNSLVKHLVTAPVLTVAALVVIAGAAVPIVRADQFDEQIRILQEQNAANRGSLNDLQSQATSFQDAISKLQLQINALQQLINDNLTQPKLKPEIEAELLKLSDEARAGKNISPAFKNAEDALDWLHQQNQ